MACKLITLPDRDEMLRRLDGVINEPHARERLFPIILKSAGEELYGMGVVMMLTLAIHGYTEGLPPMMSGIVSRYIPNFIDALVDDPEVAAEAKAIYEKAEVATNNNGD